MLQESISLTLRTPNYYHREYANDVVAWQQAEPQANQPQEETCTNICARVAVVALPFVALYKPASFFLSLGLNGARSVSSITELSGSLINSELQDASYVHLVQVAVSIIALVSTIFAHPMGMLITTGHDLIIEVAQLVQHMQSGDLKKAGQSCLTIINNTLYLALFLQGGLELGIASLAMQILIGIYHSQDELSRGNYLEAAGHMGMAMVRGGQLYDEAQALRLKWKIENLLSGAKSNLKKISFRIGSATTQNTPTQSAFPFQLPPGEWETERFDIAYSKRIYRKYDAEFVVPGTCAVYAAREKDGSHMVYYFIPQEADSQKDLIHSIGRFKNIHFHVHDYQNWAEKLGKNWYSGVQQYSGTSLDESSGRGTWKAMFNHKGALLTVSLDGKDNDDFFEKVSAHWN